MHTESAYDGCTAYYYPEQGMVDRLLRVHIQSQRAFGPWWTMSYNSPYPVLRTSSPADVSQGCCDAGAPSCCSDGRSAARPRLRRWLQRLLLVVVLGRQAG